jgi:hypothetical protein
MCNEVVSIGDGPSLLASLCFSINSDRTVPFAKGIFKGRQGAMDDL